MALSPDIPGEYLNILIPCLAFTEVEYTHIYDFVVFFLPSSFNTWTGVQQHANIYPSVVLPVAFLLIDFLKGSGLKLSVTRITNPLMDFLRSVVSVAR